MVCRFFVLSLVLLAAPTAAHGGMYRGPAPGPNTPGGMVPGTGAPGIPGPTTGRRSYSDQSDWRVWWEFNKDPYLRLRDGLAGGVMIGGSDEFFLGPIRNEEGAGRRVPSEDERRKQLVPALGKALKVSHNRDMTTAGLIALAKIGLDHPDVALLPIFREHMKRGDQEISETAVLAMGITRRQEAIEDLIALLTDAPSGRRLVGHREVSDRTRAFAAYGLGLVAHANDDVACKTRIFKALAEILTGPRMANMNLPVAVINAIRILSPDPARGSAHKRLSWQCVEALWQFYQRDLGKGRQLIQAHVPPAIARLLGRGHSSDHERFKKAFAAELTGKVRRNPHIYQSAALALGELVEPRERHTEDAPYSDALINYYAAGVDQQAQYFCLIALARIGGESNRGELMKRFVKARTLPGSWLAIALGLLAHGDRHGQEQDRGVDESIGKLLLHEFGQTKSPDLRAAIAVGLGLCRFNEAGDDLRIVLSENTSNSDLAGYICIGLALMQEERAVDQLRDLVANSSRRPGLLKQVAIALGRLGDESAAAILLKIMKTEGANVAKLAACASALELIGDSRSIPALLASVKNTGLPSLSRAFIVAALGGVGDKEVLPWNTALAVGVNYRAVVETLTNRASGVLDIL